MKYDLIYTPTGTQTNERWLLTPEEWRVSTAAEAYCEMHNLTGEKAKELVEWLAQIPKEERLNVLLTPYLNGSFVWTDSFKEHWRHTLRTFAPTPAEFTSLKDMRAYLNNPTHRGQILFGKDVRCYRASLIMRYAEKGKWQPSEIHFTRSHWTHGAFKKYCGEARPYCQLGVMHMNHEQLCSTFLVLEKRWLGDGAWEILYGGNSTSKWVIDPTGNSFIFNAALPAQAIVRKRIELTGRR